MRALYSTRTCMWWEIYLGRVRVGSCRQNRSKQGMVAVQFEL
jgi:hypothetical protein